MLTETVALGKAEGPGAIGRPAAVTTDATGRFWIVSEETDASISIFGSGGAFISSVGREGEGPEEFRALRALVPLASSMLAFDTRNVWVAELSLDGELVRSRPFPMT